MNFIIGAYLNMDAEIKLKSKTNSLSALESGTNIFTGYLFLDQANVSITYTFSSYQVGFVLIFNHVTAFQSSVSPLLMFRIQGENIFFIMSF